MTLKWILGIFATILLGAIGSGLWSLLFDPLFRKLGRVFISISSLGIRSVQNQFYIEVAKGHRERGFKLLFFVFILVIGMMPVTVITLETRYKILDKQLNEAIQIAKMKNPDKTISDDMVKLELDKIRSEWHNKSKNRLLLLSAFLILVVIFQKIKITGIESSISQFEQYINICRPYLTDDELKKFLSDFALIKSKEDFFTIIRKLEEIAKRGNLNLSG